jgi:hypothetical protein
MHAPWTATFYQEFADPSGFTLNPLCALASRTLYSHQKKRSWIHLQKFTSPDIREW